MGPRHTRLAVLTLVAGLTALPPAASAEQSIRDQLRECVQISGAVERLACFERLAQAELNRTGGAGETDRAPAEDQRRIASTIESLERRPHGEYIFHLANGQTWTETQPGRLRHEPGAEVVLQRTFMGSWMMRVEGGRTIRVRQID